MVSVSLPANDERHLGRCAAVPRKAKGSSTYRGRTRLEEIQSTAYRLGCNRSWQSDAKATEFMRELRRIRKPPNSTISSGAGHISEVRKMRSSFTDSDLFGLLKRRRKPKRCRRHAKGTQTNSLIGFGTDSLIESLSGGILLWLLQQAQTDEARATRVKACGHQFLCAGVVRRD